MTKFDSHTMYDFIIVMFCIIVVLFLRKSDIVRKKTATSFSSLV